MGLAPQDRCEAHQCGVGEIGQFGQKNLLGWAIMVTVLFVWSLVAMNVAIERTDGRSSLLA